VSRSTRIAAVGAALMTTVATGLWAAPAQAATTGVVSVVSTTKIRYKAGSGHQNRVVITRSGNTITVDDRVAIKAGKGCKAVKGDKTKVRCTPAEAPTRIQVFAGDRNDRVENRTDLGMTARGDNGSDILIGGPRRDVLWGENGNDRLYGNGGDDDLEGLGDNDRIWGGEGADRIIDSDGNDIIAAGGGGDYISAGAGDDRLYGTAGADYLYGYEGSDVIYGFGGDDMLNGEEGSDRLYGGAGDDEVQGYDRGRAGGKDLLDGGFSTDTCTPEGTDTRVACEI
jgi:serralysin